ncbi:MAG: DUF2188 domain-containing protein [Kineosporiaceae bacterium]|nr:DUF2188 domain-containing protein [Aeromicrobium sp.]
MTSGDIETYFQGNGWHSRVQGDSHPFHTSDNKERAIEAGRDEAKARKVEHVINDKDGQISERNLYGEGRIMSKTSEKGQSDADSAQKNANQRGPAGDPESNGPLSETSPDRSGAKIAGADTTKDTGATPPQPHKGQRPGGDSVSGECL